MQLRPRRDRKGALPRFATISGNGIGLIASLLAATATGEELISESAMLGGVPIVVSATRLAQRTDEAPAAVTVIDRGTIEASGAVELVDLLRLVPGFQVAHTTGNLYTVSAHGTGAPWFSRLQVLIDGRSVYHTAFSGLDWAQLGIALVDIERLEVVRGPNTPTYGANAIQGTVNIVTRHPVQDRGWFLQGTAGRTERFDGVVRYAGTLADLDYRVTLQHRQNDGFANRLDDTRANSLTFRGIVTPTPLDELDIQVDLTASSLGDDLFPGFFPNAERDVNSQSLFARWTHAHGSDESWYLQVARDHYDTDEDARLLVSEWFQVPPFYVPLLLGKPDQSFAYNQFEADSLRHDIEFQQFLAPRDDLRLAWGTGYRRDAIQHFLSDSPDRHVSARSWRLFGNAEWRPGDRWVVNLGAMVDDNTLGGTSFSPRLGVNFRLPNQDTLRFSATRAYKHPSLLEEHWYAMMRLDDGTPITLWAVSNGNLEPERRDVVELGYLGERLGGRLQFDTRLYRESVTDAVIYARDTTCPQPLSFPFCYRVGNYLAYDVRGAELGLTYKPSPRETLRLQYAYADVDGEVPYYTMPYVGESLDHTAPRHSGGLLWSYRWPGGWETDLGLYYVDETYWYLDGGLVDAYLRTDLRLAKRLRLADADAKLELIAQNLGSSYQEFGPANDFDTRLFLRLSLAYR